VNPHGGPWYRDGWGYNPEIQFLAKRGVEVQYMVKDNEGHGFRNEENQFEFYEAMEKFFARRFYFFSPLAASWMASPACSTFWPAVSTALSTDLPARSIGPSLLGQPASVIGRLATIAISTIFPKLIFIPLGDWLLHKYTEGAAFSVRCRTHRDRRAS
jgi:hypothetical protein